MKWINVKDRSRNDFWGTTECEHCGFVDTNAKGYDDFNYHENVVPSLRCPACLSTAQDTPTADVQALGEQARYERCEEAKDAVRLLMEGSVTKDNAGEVLRLCAELRRVLHI